MKPPFACGAPWAWGSRPSWSMCSAPRPRRPTGERRLHPRPRGCSSTRAPCTYVTVMRMPVGEIALSKFPVLVVDDESDNLDAFRFTFGKTFPLHYAGSGEEALALAREHDVAVVVTDQRMPRMTGLELLRAVREVRPDAIGIIVTAFTDVDVLIESINLG